MLPPAAETAESIGPEVPQVAAEPASEEVAAETAPDSQLEEVPDWTENETAEAEPSAPILIPTTKRKTAKKQAQAQPGASSSAAKPAEAVESTSSEAKPSVEGEPAAAAETAAQKKERLKKQYQEKLQEKKAQEQKVKRGPAPPDHPPPSPKRKREEAPEGTPVEDAARRRKLTDKKLSQFFAVKPLASHIAAASDPGNTPQKRVTGAEVRAFDRRDNREDGVIDLDLPDNLPLKLSFDERLKYRERYSPKELQAEPPWRSRPRLRAQKKANRVRQGLKPTHRGKRSKSGERRYLEKKVLYELRKENPHLCLIKVRTAPDLEAARRTGKWPSASCKSRSSVFLEPNPDSEQGEELPICRKNQLEAKKSDSKRAEEVNEKLEEEGIELESRTETIASSRSDSEEESDSDSCDSDSESSSDLAVEVVSKEESDRITELLETGTKTPTELPAEKEESEQPSAASSKDQVEATTLPEVCSEGYLPEGTKITYKGEEVTLRESAFFTLGAKRFRARFTQTAEGLLRIVTEAPGKELSI